MLVMCLEEFHEFVWPSQRAVDADLVGLLGVIQNGLVRARQLRNDNPGMLCSPLDHRDCSVGWLSRQVDTHPDTRTPHTPLAGARSCR